MVSHKKWTEQTPFLILKTAYILALLRRYEDESKRLRKELDRMKSELEEAQGMCGAVEAFALSLSLFSLFSLLSSFRSDLDSLPRAREAYRQL